MNEKIDWRRKLSSRKLWAATAGFVTGLLIFFGMPESQAAQIGSLILQGASIIAYIVCEGFIDAARAGANTIVVNGVVDDPGDDAE